MADASNLLQPQGKTSPDVIIHGAEATAPAAAQVMADSGAIPRFSKVMVLVSWGADDNVATFEVVRRNAANSADVEKDYSGVPVAGSSGFVSWFSLLAGERIVVRALVAGTAAMVYQASLFLWIVP
jgi:hypothetical protein